jgi:hypothetical protein
MDMKTHVHPAQKAVHNMAVVGDHAIFLSHLPMFMPPHDAQVVVEANLIKDGKNVDAIYFADRASHRGLRFYTLQPESFAIRELFQIDAPKHALRSHFTATMFRGHLEKGGTPVVALQNVEVRIKRLVHAHSFAGADKAAMLSYVLFGGGQELYLAHLISKAPDFDQIVAITATGTLPSAEELQRGVTVNIPGRTNSARDRLKVKEAVPAQAHAAGAHQFLNLRIAVVAELYFEEGELSSASMNGTMFDQTVDEKKAGFE